MDILNQHVNNCLSSSAVRTGVNVSSLNVMQGHTG